MLDCNSLTLAITDLQLWVLVNIWYAYQLTDERCMIKSYNEKALNIVLVAFWAENVHSKRFGSLIKGYT